MCACSQISVVHVVAELPSVARLQYRSYEFQTMMDSRGSSTMA